MCSNSGRRCMLLVRCLIVWMFLTNILVVLYTLKFTPLEIG